MSPRFLSAEQCKNLFDRIQRMCTGGGYLTLTIRSAWVGNIRWARNQVISSGDTVNHQLSLLRVDRGAAAIHTNKIDDASLQECVRHVEHLIKFDKRYPEWYSPPRKAESYHTPQLWSNATVQVDASTRGAIQRDVIKAAVSANLWSAGYLEIAAIGNGVVNSEGLFAYVPQTRAEYSVTVRNMTGTGSGWAGSEHLDWTKLDPAVLSTVALEKCQQSADPVAVEPGRYTVVLEPQAVAEFMLPLIESLGRLPSEGGSGPWADRVSPPDPILGGRARFGEQVLDKQVTLWTDPLDSDAPFLPFGDYQQPTRKVTWITDGVLTALEYGRGYALPVLNQEDPMMNTGAFRMAGGTTSIAEMIRATARGLLITRFVQVRRLNSLDPTLLCTGRTSDGVWLIERGQITKSVKNFRFRESPVYAFNNLVTLGPTARVLMKNPTIVPSALIRDFSLTSLSDGV